MGSQWEFAEWHSEPKPGALWQPRGVGWGWEVGRRLKRKGTCVYLWLIHVDVWHRQIQYCKAIILQFKKVLSWDGSNSVPSWGSTSNSSSLAISIISSASVRSIPFLSFIEPIFAWNVLLVSLIFLKRSLVIPILLFSSVSLHWSLRKAFLSLLAILWNSAFRCLYLSFFPLPFASLLFRVICKASPDSHFAFSHFFFLEMVLLPVSYTISRTSVHSSSGTLSSRSS